jgi:DNA-binding MarR family transcriptional regulator
VNSSGVALRQSQAHQGSIREARLGINSYSTYFLAWRGRSLYYMPTMPCRVGEPDDNRLAEMARTCACNNFRKAARSVTQAFDQGLSQTGLRSTQLVILITARLLGPSSIARLARELVMDRSTLTRNLKPLLAMGFLRLSKPDRGKHKSVELTDEGCSALGRVIPAWQECQTQLVSHFGSEHWNRIMADLTAIVDATRNGGVPAPHLAPPGGRSSGRTSPAPQRPRN